MVHKLPPYPPLPSTPPLPNALKRRGLPCILIGQPVRSHGLPRMLMSQGTSSILVVAVLCDAVSWCRAIDYMINGYSPGCFCPLSMEKEVHHGRCDYESPPPPVYISSPHANTIITLINRTGKSKSSHHHIHHTTPPKSPLCFSFVGCLFKWGNAVVSTRPVHFVFWKQSETLMRSHLHLWKPMKRSALFAANQKLSPPSTFPSWHLFLVA